MGILALVGSLLLKAVIPMLATAASAYGVDLVRKLAKKAGLDVSQAQAERIEQAIETAVLAVEEHARKVRTTTGETVPSKVKEAIAVSMVRESFPKLSRDIVERLIAANLQRTRIETP